MEHKQPDSIIELQKKYQRAGLMIAKAVEGKGAGTVKAYNAAIQKVLKRVIDDLSVVNHHFAYEELEKAFKGGQKIASHKTPDTADTVKVKQVNNVLKKAGFKYSSKAFGYNAYIELQSATKQAGEGFLERINGIINELSKAGKDSVANVRLAVITDMSRRGTLSIKYASGANMPLEAYASMVARSARTEAQNIGGIGYALEHGTDLVQMSSVYPTCPVCAKFQGRVYSISGEDKRFTWLFGNDGPLSHGYALVHPNCRHRFLPYFEKLHARDMQAESKKSKSIDKFEESERNAKAYAQWQAGNRQRNDEMLEYNRLKAEYEKQGKIFPYKTLGGFRRGKRSHSAEYSSL